MRICEDHWTLCREAVDERGMSPLVAPDGETGFENIADEAEGEATKKTFHPLMSLNWHFTNNALRYRGLYVMTQDETGSPYCPICEFEKHAPGFVAKEEIGAVTDQMSAWVRSEGLLAAVN
jgi:hypothetical protein